MTQKLTEGNPRKLIFFYMLPLLVGNLVQQIYSLADTFIVGRFIGSQALAGVGSVSTIMFLVFGFAIASMSGLTIPMAQKFGANDLDGVRRSFAAGMVLATLIAAVITVVGTVFSRPILQLMNTPADIIGYAHDYQFWVFCGAFALVGYNFLSSVLRALGDSRTPLYFLAFASVVNIVLDLIFIVNFHLGVTGAAVATVIAMLLSCVLCLGYIFWKVPVLRVKRSDFCAPFAEYWEQLRLGLPMGLQSSVIAIGTITIQVALNHEGSAMVAAYTAAQRIEQLALFPFLSFGISVGVFAAQNLGAMKHERIWEGVKETCKMSALYGVVISTILLCFSGALVGTFFGENATAEIVWLGQLYLYVTVPFYPSLLLLFIYRNTLQGLGNSLLPTISGFVELGARVLTAWFIAPVWGYAGILVCHPLAWMGACVLLYWAYSRERK